MATTRAIEAVCDTVVSLLRDSVPTVPATPPLQFRVFTQADFATGLTAGVSLFLYRIHVDGTERTPDGRERADGRRQVPQLPVQLHFVLTLWGTEASLQHYLAGWALRTIEDHPVLPAGLLNRRYEPDSTVFRPDETVELSHAALSTDELLQLWDVIGTDAYQLSLPYQARGIRLESDRLLPDGVPVVERVRAYRLIGDPR
jgi:hypothetical protein